MQDVSDSQLPTQRIHLWLNEPALRARYTEYVAEAERVIADCLARNRGTSFQNDDLPKLIAVAATGAYRVTILTDTPARGARRLTEHLREALVTIGNGLADEAGPELRSVPPS
jgi:hypothetical protein